MMSSSSDLDRLDMSRAFVVFVVLVVLVDQSLKPHKFRVERTER